MQNIKYRLRKLRTGSRPMAGGPPARRRETRRSAWFRSLARLSVWSTFFITVILASAGSGLVREVWLSHEWFPCPLPVVLAVLYDQTTTSLRKPSALRRRIKKRQDAQSDRNYRNTKPRVTTAVKQRRSCTFSSACIMYFFLFQCLALVSRVVWDLFGSGLIAGLLRMK